jgi:hypothetical protein
MSAVTLMLLCPRRSLATLRGTTPPGPTPVLQRQHAIDNPAHLMAKWMWLSNLLQSGILTTNEIRDLDRRLSGHHQNC